jgi:hypothetical protein
MSDIFNYSLRIPPIDASTEKQAEEGVDFVVVTEFEGVIRPHMLNFVVYGYASKQHAQSWIFDALESANDGAALWPMRAMHKLTDVNEFDHGMLPDRGSDFCWQPEKSKRRRRID